MDHNEARSETAFIIIPRHADGNENLFIVVKDKNDPEKIFQNKKKWPGGGEEEGDLSLGWAAVREAKEETGLDIFPPTEKILEVHKPSVWDGRDVAARSMHRDVFFKSQPPIDISFFVSGDRSAAPDSLVIGAEIEEAAWQSHNAILESIRQGQFFPNHAAAFIWKTVREQFLKTRDSILLAPIVWRKNLCSWHIDGAALILCFYEQCRICRYTKAPIHQKVDAHESEQGVPQNELLAGAVRFIITQSDAFFDYVYLEPIRGTQATYRLPAAIIEEGKKAEAEDVLRIKAHAYDWGLVEYAGLFKKNNSYFIIARSNEDRILGLERFCINKHPPLIFLEDDREWRELCESITDNNNNKKRERKIEINHEWWVQKNPKTTSSL